MKDSSNKDRTKKKYLRLSSHMTDDELDFSADIIHRINQRIDEMSDRLEEAFTFNELYNNDPEVKAGRPNTKINVIHPNIEGQVADIVLQEIGLDFQGQEYTDTQFADWARVNTEWTRDNQKNFTQILTTFVRRLLKFGWAYMYAEYDKDFCGGFGITKFSVPAIDRVVIDSKIKNIYEIEDAEYVSILFNCSKQYAISEYGEDKAELITYGVTSLDEDNLFENKDYLLDDDTAWLLIKTFTKDDGKLRRRDYDSSGLLLWDSFKGDDKKENQKDNEVVPKSLYSYVYDNYPLFMANCYDVEGELQGFGDIKLIAELQKVMIDMYDNIRMATRPNKTLVDSRSSIVPEDVTNDSFEPLVFEGEELNGQPPTREVSFGSANPEWWRIIANIHDEIQRTIRYSELMLGQSGSATTATQSAIQERQGSRSTSMKQKSVESVVRDMFLYSLGLDLQYRSGKKAFRLQGENNSMEWVDYDLLKNIPSTTPMEAGERKKWLDDGYEISDIPQSQITMENGIPVTRSIKLDLKVTIGSQAQNTSAVKSQMINQMAAMQLLAKDGTVKPAVYWDELRDYMTKEFGLPLQTSKEVSEGLRQYEEMQKKKQEMEMQAQQAAIESQQMQTQQANSDSTLPNGTPPSIVEPDAREGLGVMQGNSDFQNTL